MKINAFALCLVAGLAVLGSGCVNTLDDKSQMGVPFLKDSVESSYKAPAADVLQAARAVLSENGTLKSDNTVLNSLEADIKGATVWVRIYDVDPAAPLTRMAVQGRSKGGGADVELAHEVSERILLKLAPR